MSDDLHALLTDLARDLGRLERLGTVASLNEAIQIMDGAIRSWGDYPVLDDFTRAMRIRRRHVWPRYELACEWLIALEKDF